MVDASDAVWLSVLPDMKSFGPALIKGAGSESDKVGKSVGKRFGLALVAGVAAIGAGAAAAGRALYKIGETFDDVSDTIRVGTGATGAALDGLVESAKNVGTRVPAEFSEIGTVIADINTRLGLTGETLETFASQVLEAGRITGEAIDINTVSGAFSQFKIAGEDTTGAMDRLFQVSQATGVGINDLASQASLAGPVMQNLGFGFEDTTALIGNLDKAGLNARGMMSGLSMGLTRLVKDGEAPAEAFQRTTEEIAGFLEAGDQASAIDLAGKMFGTRNASQFIGAVQSGTLALDDLSSVAGITEDTILGAGEETMDFAEQWQLFKNDILTQIEPAASRLFGAIGDGMKWIKDTGLPAFKDFAGQMKDRFGPAVSRIGDFMTTRVVPAFKTLGGFITGTLIPGFRDFVGWLKQNAEWLKPIAVGIGTMIALWVTYKTTLLIVSAVQKAWTAITTAMTAAQKALNMALRANPIGIVITILAGLVAALVYAYKHSETFRNIVNGAWNAIKKGVGAVWSFLRDKVFKPLVQWFKDTGKRFGDMKDTLVKAWNTVKSKFSAGWDWIKLHIFQAFINHVKRVRDNFRAAIDRVVSAWNSIKSAFKAVVDWIKTNVINRFKDSFDGLLDKVRTIRDKLGEAWARIANKFRKPINWVINTVWNDGIAAAFNRAAGAIGISTRLPDAVSIPAFAKGGRHDGGWALVGERGPELVNFSQPGRVYTADETRAALSGPAAQVPAIGDLWGTVSGWVSNAVDWVRGGLASAAGALLNPLKALISNTVGQWGTFGRMGGGVASNVIDRVLSWIRGKDDEGPGSGSWRRPSRGPITSEYGMRWGRLHAGIDIAGGGPTYAAAAGTVAKTGWNIGPGRTGIGILLSHGGGVYTYYGHNPPGGVKVSVGDTVRAGQRIGSQGATGNVTGTHLHFEYQPNGAWGAVNPRKLGVFDQGGMLAPGAMAINLGSKPEPVLTPGQWQSLASGRGGAGQEFNFNGPITTVDVDAMARAVAQKQRDAMAVGRYQTGGARG